MTINKKKILRFLTVSMWCIIGAGCIVLLVSAARGKEIKKCSGVDIDITGVNNIFFIDKTDVYNIIKNFGGDSSGKKSIGSIDLRRIENALEKDVWIKNAELFFDNNNRLRVFVEEREPIARIFTLTGNTFYIDSSCKMLPLSEKFSARLPVFTGFTSDAKVLSREDSSLLKSVRNISVLISADSFLMAMIDQVDINAQRSFEMTPKIGKQNILFGDGRNAEAKFAKLKLFYKEVITKAGWNRYNTIDLQYDGQVVAKIRGKEDVIADSLRTLELIKFIASDAAKRSADSLQTIMQDTKGNTADSSLIQQSMQRDEGEGAAFQPDVKPDLRPVAPVVEKPVPTPVQKPVTTTVQKPVTTIVNKPITAAPKPVAKPAVKNDKPAVVKKPPAKSVLPVKNKPKPKAEMPKTSNEY